MKLQMVVQAGLKVRGVTQANGQEGMIAMQMISDVPALAWPGSPGFGLAFLGFGFSQSQARPLRLALTWLGLALAQARAFTMRKGEGEMGKVYKGVGRGRWERGV